MEIVQDQTSIKLKKYFSIKFIICNKFLAQLQNDDNPVRRYAREPHAQKTKRLRRLSAHQAD